MKRLLMNWNGSDETKRWGGISKCSSPPQPGGILMRAEDSLRGSAVQDKSAVLRCSAEFRRSVADHASDESGPETGLRTLRSYQDPIIRY